MTDSHDRWLRDLTASGQFTSRDGLRLQYYSEGRGKKHILICNMAISKTLPTDPWSIPQTPNQQFMKEFLSFGVWGCLGYAPGLCWVSLRQLISLGAVLSRDEHS